MGHFFNIKHSSPANRYARNAKFSYNAINFFYHPQSIPEIFSNDKKDLLQTDLSLLLTSHTSYAISLGAPFWFDLLNKFMKIRSTIKPSKGDTNKQD